MFGGVPTGVANAVDAAIATTIRIACGLTPILLAIAKQIGASNVELAVFDIN